MTESANVAFRHANRIPIQLQINSCLRAEKRRSAEQSFLEAHTYLIAGR